MDRRDALRALAGGVVAAAVPSCRPTIAVEGRSTLERAMPSATPRVERLPAVFLPHGGGPWPFMDESVFGGPGAWTGLRRYLEQLNMMIDSRPTAILVVSAHWEAAVPTVMSSTKPPMFYDYYGFPPETYTVEWPAPGAPEVAGRVRELLEDAGIRAGQDEDCGFDHGTFVPLALAYPDADVPTLQVSLKHGLNPREHLAIGQALAPLREEGVLIVGSGMSYHNLGAIRGARATIAAHSAAFDDWLSESLALEPNARETRLVEWERAPSARDCHPREEHLLPLMVVAGAAYDAAATLPFREVVLGARVSAAHFA